MFTDFELSLQEIRKKMTIYTVDDFANVCRILRSILKDIGFNAKNVHIISRSTASVEMNNLLETFKDYEQALSWKIPGVLFLDWNMPNLTGFELLKNIRESDDPRISDMIVIMVSAEAIHERVMAAINAGVDNYITKPFSQNMVERKFAEVSKNLVRKLEREMREQPLNNRDIGSLIEKINLAIALDLDNKKAQKMKQKVLRGRDKEVTEIVKDKVRKGKRSVENGKYNRAVGEFGGALTIKSSDPVTLMEYGKMMMKKTLYEEAAASFQSSLKYLLKDENAQSVIKEVDLLHLLGHAQLKLSMSMKGSVGVTEEAIKTFRRAVEFHQKEKDKQGEANSLKNIGDILFAIANEAERNALKAKDATESGKYKMEALKQNRLAISEYEKSVRQDIKQSSTLIKLAQAYRNIGKNEESLQAIQKAVALDPEDSATLIEFGKAFLAKGEKETAMRYLNSAAKKFSKENIELYAEIIITLLENDCPDEAVPFIKTIADERPDFYNDLGLSYRRKNEFEKAIESYNKALKYDITGDRVRYLFNRGMAYKMSGNYVAAIENFIEGYTLDKTFEEAVEQLNNVSNDLCEKAQESLKSADKSSSLRYFKLAFLANQNNEDAKIGIIKCDIEPSSILTKEELMELGINNPSMILENFS